MNAGGIKPLASLDAAMLGRRGLARRVPLSFGAPEAGAPEAGGPAEVPEVIRQVERLAAALGLDGPAPAVAEPGEPARRIAFTLRIDPVRHARLRQVVAAEGRSAQLVLTDALDLYCGRAAAASSPAIIASHRTTPTGNQP
ncbi:hypothetical protein [Novosphingobium acidiphilum]|uniref:hypothetical protein n=1 Tax=Novosphingobium acidiphilum TaxID=505248 RepID=UPI000420BEF0|nr:hypothetical protein [Novosphingobium acidiphilum]